MPETPALRRCLGRCGKMRMSTRADRICKPCRKEHAKLPRLAQSAIARLPEKRKEEDEGEE